MDWNLLPVFVAVAEHHSFTKAAKQLGMQRSAVSRRVAALEADLGVQLLFRSTRHVEVTTAGRRLLRDVAPLLDRLEAAVHELPEASAEPAGELRITAPEDWGLWLLPPVLGELTRKYPAVRPVVSLSNRVIDLEGEGFDVALRVSTRPLPDSNLRARRLGPLLMRLYAAPSYLAHRGVPASVDDLDEHTLVGLPVSMPDEFSRRMAVEADDMVFVAELAIHGVGLAFLPAILGEDAVADGRLVHVLPEIEASNAVLHAVFPSSRELPPKITAFRDELLAWLAANPLPVSPR